MNKNKNNIGTKGNTYTFMLTKIKPKRRIQFRENKSINTKFRNESNNNRKRK